MPCLPKKKFKTEDYGARYRILLNIFVRPLQLPHLLYAHDQQWTECPVSSMPVRHTFVAYFSTHFV